LSRRKEEMRERERRSETTDTAQREEICGKMYKVYKKEDTDAAKSTSYTTVDQARENMRRNRWEDSGEK
jgi:hypothetical protein